MAENPKADMGIDTIIKNPDSSVLKEILGKNYQGNTSIVEVIAKYNGDIMRLEKDLGVGVEVLSPTYAIVTMPANQIYKLLDYSEIEYIELPKLLGIMLENSVRASCITPLQNGTLGNLNGEGTIVAILDSGIDYTHPDFRNEDGTTRIKYLWDQTETGTPPNGFKNGAEYTDKEINAALKAPIPEEGLGIVPHQDVVGHGTHVTYLK